MSQGQLDAVVRHLRRLAGAADTDRTDGQLLEKFVGCRDEIAFATLVRRHGGLIRTVCRHILHREEDVEDALQATLLVLACKAASIRKGDSVTSWLYGVAYRTAMNAKKTAARRRERERQAVSRSPEQPVSEAALRELQALLDEEVQRLPDTYRAPFVLCCLEGKSKAEAARELGWKEGTVSGRLARARKRLQQRLAGRGVTLSAALCATGLFQDTATAAVPAAVIHGVLSFTAGKAGAVSAPTAALAQGVLKAMFATKLKLGVVLLLAVGALATGVGLAAHHVSAAKQPEANQSERPKAVAERTEQPRPDVDKPAPRPDARPSPPMERPERKDAHGDPLPPGALVRLGTLRFRHSQNVSDIAFAPDGKTLAAVDSGMVCLWEAATGKELRRLERATAGHGLAFAPDGKCLATAVQSDLLFSDPVTGQQLRRFPLRGERVQSLAFSPDGKALAWLDQDNNLRLSDAATGKVLHQWPGPPHIVYSSVAFSPDSRTLALACQKENEVPLYDTSTGKEVRRFVGHQATVYAVTFSPDGKTLVSSARDNTLRFWDAATGKELRQAKHDGGVWKLAFSPDGTVLATGGSDVRLWDPATGKAVRSCERDEDGYVLCLAFSPDSKTLAASRENSHALSLWDVASGKKQLAFAGHLGLVSGVAISPDGTLLASAAEEKNYTGRNAVHLWDPVTGKEVGTVGNDLGFVEGLTFSPDGRLLAAGNEDGTIRIWDAATRREVRRLTGHKSMVEGIGFSADGKVLASLGYHDRTIRLWDVAAGKPLRQFPGNQPRPLPGGGIALAPDGKTIVQGGEEQPSLVLWDAATGKAVNRFGDYGGHVSALALSPDGRMLAAAERGGGVRLWDVASGKEVRRVANPNVWVGFLVFSADGRTLASGGADRTVRLWEVATGTERCQFVGHCGAVRSGAFSPDGRRFFSGSQDTTVLIWDVTGRVAKGRAEMVKLSPRELEDLRTDLAAADASRAHRALWKLAAAPAQAVGLFRDQLRPVAAANPERVARLLADLDSDVFARRDEATKELQKLGEGLLPALHKALAGRPSAELRRRAEQLVQRLAVWSPERLYELRAVEVLERIGSPEARRLLERIAGGAVEARLTQEAKASLERLAQRPAGTP